VFDVHFALDYRNSRTLVALLTEKIVPTTETRQSLVCTYKWRDSCCFAAARSRCRDRDESLFLRAMGNRKLERSRISISVPFGN